MTDALFFIYIIVQSERLRYLFTGALLNRTRLYVYIYIFIDRWLLNPDGRGFEIRITFETYYKRKLRSFKYWIRNARKNTYTRYYYYSKLVRLGTNWKRRSDVRVGRYPIRLCNTTLSFRSEHSKTNTHFCNYYSVSAWKKRGTVNKHFAWTLA